MATRAKAPTKSTKKPAPKAPRGPRGAELVERVLTAGREALTERIPAPKPLDTAALAGLALPGGVAVPASLRRWLAFDASWLGLVHEGRLQPLPLAELALFEDANYGAAFGALQPQLSAGCLPLRRIDEADEECFFFLYLDGADDAGEFPVLGCSNADSGVLGVAAPGFDVYLARCFGLADAEAKVGAPAEGYEEAHREATKRVLGRRSLLDAPRAEKGSFGEALLVDAAASALGVSRAAVWYRLRAELPRLKSELDAKERATVPGLGTFTGRTAREGRNPFTGGVVRFPGKVRFQREKR